MTSVSRTLRPGDLILSAEPFTHMLEPSLWGQRCHSCLGVGACEHGVPQKLKRCGGCLTFAYCGKVCQAKDWKAYHKLGECKFFKRVKDTGIMDVWMKAEKTFAFAHTLRIYLLCKSKPEMMDKEYPLVDGSTRTFRQLMSNTEEWEKAENGQKIQFLRLVVNANVKNILPDLDVDFFIECMHKKNTNIMILEQVEVVAKGVYIQCSPFDHSCRPNASTTNIGAKIEMRAIRDIPAGEQIFRSYVPIFLPRAQRHAQLKYYFFDCQCEKCLAGDEPDFETKYDTMEVLRAEANAISYQNPETQVRHVFDSSRLLYEACESLVDIPYHTCLTTALVNLVISALPVRKTSKDLKYLRPILSKAMKHFLVTHGTGHHMFDRLQYAISTLESEMRA